METKVTGSVRTGNIEYTLHLTTNDTPRNALKLIQEAMEQPINMPNSVVPSESQPKPCQHASHECIGTARVSKCNDCGLIFPIPTPEGVGGSMAPTIKTLPRDETRGYFMPDCKHTYGVRFSFDKRPLCSACYKEFTERELKDLGFFNCELFKKIPPPAKAQLEIPFPLPYNAFPKNKAELLAMLQQNLPEDMVCKTMNVKHRNECIDSWWQGGRSGVQILTLVFWTKP